MATGEVCGERHFRAVNGVYKERRLTDARELRINRQVCRDINLVGLGAQVQMTRTLGRKFTAFKSLVSALLGIMKSSLLINY